MPYQQRYARVGNIKHQQSASGRPGNALNSQKLSKQQGLLESKYLLSPSEASSRKQLANEKEQLVKEVSQDGEVAEV